MTYARPLQALPHFYTFLHANATKKYPVLFQQPHPTPLAGPSNRCPETQKRAETLCSTSSCYLKPHVSTSFIRFSPHSQALPSRTDASVPHRSWILMSPDTTSVHAGPETGRLGELRGLDLRGTNGRVDTLALRIQSYPLRNHLLEGPG